MNFLATLSLGQPLGLLGLVLPIAFLVAARERGRAQPRLVGSLSIWKQVVGENEVSSMARKAPLTPRILLIAMAMGLAALALGSPTWTHQAPPRIWRMILETGASQGLASESASRLDTAVAAGVDWARVNAPGSRIFWVGPMDDAGRYGAEETAAGEAPSNTFLELIRGAQRPRIWNRFDSGDCMWLPTSGGGAAPRLAGLPELAFEAVPGPAALLRSGKCLWWEPGSEMAERELPLGAAPATVLLQGAALAVGTPIGDVALAWAQSRGLATSREASVLNAVLHLEGMDDLAPRAVSLGARLGRDGWNAQGTWMDGEAVSLEPWIANDGRVIIGWRPGYIRVGLAALSEPSGDPAAFAVSWSNLFDRAALAGAGVVSVAARMAVQVEGREPADNTERDSRAPGGAESQRDSAFQLAPLLAVLAAAILLGVSFKRG